MAEYIYFRDGMLTDLTHERIVRCMDCKYSCPYGDGIECLGPLVQTWDYKNDSPMHNPVPRSGFCYLGKPRETDE